MLVGLPWRDQLLVPVPDGEPVPVPGEILGDWKAAAVVFRPDPEASLPDAPAAAPLVAARTSGTGELRVERAADEGGYDWRPSMPRAFRDMERAGLVQAILLFTLSLGIAITRWWRLLAVAGCPTRWVDAARLTFLGMFFNLVVPGLTGGDLVKGVIAAKENPGRRADALVSVAVDRLIGLGVLVALGAAVLLVSGEAFAELRRPVLAFLGIGVAAALLYANPHLRRWLGIERLLARLPFGDRLGALDRAALLYFRHPLELLFAGGLSLANHVVIVLGVAALGDAFGVQDVRLANYFVLVPVANVVSSIPAAPGGWGLGEYVYQVLFEMIGASGALGVAVSVTFRLCQMLFGLVGGLFLLLPSVKREVREVAGT